MDPTGTTQLRTRFRADAQRHLDKLRSATYNQLVQKDSLNPLANIFGQPDQVVISFIAWFKYVATMSLVEDGWWYRHLKRAYGSGLDAGEEILGTDRPLDYFTEPPNRYIQLARTDLETVVSALTQHVTRTLTTGAQNRDKPLNTYRQVLEQIRKVGTDRLNTFSNSHTVLAHNAGRLAVFRAAGVDRVGVIPETLPVSPMRSRDGHHPHRHVVDAGNGVEPSEGVGSSGIVEEYEGELFGILTAGDDKVCIECEIISDSGPYELDLAETLIPSHYNCRCTIVPAEDYSPEELLGEDD